MCGIFACKPAIENWLKSALLEHDNRGPDQSAQLVVGDIGLAVNRLAITGDLESGSQPVFSKSKKTVCVFNGAIFNYRELIEEYSLRPSSENDAAVALELFELEGQNLFNVIQGMFSIIIVDLKNKSMTVGRDTLGIKPLYWASNNGRILFSSSINAIPKSMLPFVQTFPPGKVWNDSGTLRKIVPIIKDRKDTETLLLETVKKHIPNEVKWGCSLSGGLDSSLVCAMAKNLGYEFKCYVLDAGVSGDRDAAQLVADHLGLPLKVVKVTKDDVIEAIPVLVKALATYNMTIILGALCTYFIAKAASRDGLKVLFFGDGADETFAGYKRYKDCETVEEAQKKLIYDQEKLWLTQNKRLDHASMVMSIEARVPFQDLNIVINSRELPLHKKVDERNKFKDKIILREIAEKYLPANIASREKTVVSSGTGLNTLLIEAIKDMWGKPYLHPITYQDLKAYGVKDKVEMILFTFFKKNYYYLSGNLADLESRNLYSRSLA